MKRFLLLVFLTSTTLSWAQSWSAYDERWYHHNYHYDSIPVKLISIHTPKIHPKEITLKTVISFEEGRFFFLHAETTNSLDYGGSRLFLGLDPEAAMQTLKGFHAMLALPAGTRDTIANDGYTCYLLIKEDPKYGKMLVTRRVNDGGTITFDGHLFDILEETFANYDEEAISCFPHKTLENRDEIKAEIKRYKSLSEFVIPYKDLRFCYTPDFYELFRQRIKEYRKDLRKLRKEEK